jgi:hypothetical protein
MPRPPILSPRERSLLFIAHPGLWPMWPVLPLVRRTRGMPELGVMFDFKGTTGRTGFGAAVLLSNLFELPPSGRDLLALPREVYDSADEIVHAGWEVD